jgi:thymidine phosphorylase
LLIDIPVGPTAKVRHTRDALKLRKLFEYVGDRLGIHLEVVLTNGMQPIGNGIGPVLEARDVMRVLKNQPEAPFDLREKSLRLAGRILEFDPDVRGGHGYTIARDILESGRAFEKMQSIMKVQGLKTQSLKDSPLELEIKAQKSGYVSTIDNFLLSQIASLAGAPMDKTAGVDLFRKIGDKVAKDEPLYKIYASFQSDFEFATQLARAHSGYLIKSQPPELVEAFLV